MKQLQLFDLISDKPPIGTEIIVIGEGEYTVTAHCGTEMDVFFVKASDEDFWHLGISGKDKVWKYK